MSKWVVNMGAQELIFILGGLFCLLVVPLAILLVVFLTKKKPPPLP